MSFVVINLDGTKYNNYIICNTLAERLSIVHNVHVHMAREFAAYSFIDTVRKRFNFDIRK